MNTNDMNQKKHVQRISGSLIGFIYNDKKIETKKQIENLSKEDIKNILIHISTGDLILDKKYLEYINTAADKHDLIKPFCNSIFDNVEKTGSHFSKEILTHLKEISSKNPDSIPKIELSTTVTTTAYFDQATNTILVDKKYEKDLDNLIDNILFEYCNFLNKDELQKTFNL